MTKIALVLIGCLMALLSQVVFSSPTLRNEPISANSIAYGKTITIKRGLALAFLQTMKPKDPACTKFKGRRQFPYFHPIVRVRSGQPWGPRHAESVKDHGGRFLQGHYANMEDKLGNERHVEYEEEGKEGGRGDERNEGGFGVEGEDVDEEDRERDVFPEMF